jgi:hypothetical protein
MGSSGIDAEFERTPRRQEREEVLVDLGDLRGVAWDLSASTPSLIARHAAKTAKRFS